MSPAGCSLRRPRFVRWERGRRQLSARSAASPRQLLHQPLRCPCGQRPRPAGERKRPAVSHTSPSASRSWYGSARRSNAAKASDWPTSSRHPGPTMSTRSVAAQLPPPSRRTTTLRRPGSTGRWGAEAFRLGGSVAPPAPRGPEMRARTACPERPSLPHACVCRRGQVRSAPATPGNFGVGRRPSSARFLISCH